MIKAYQKDGDGSKVLISKNHLILEYGLAESSFHICFSTKLYSINCISDADLKICS